MQPQNKGPGMLWGQSYVLLMTWGGGGIWGGPFSRHAALWLFHLVKQSYEVAYLWALVQFWQCTEPIAQINPWPS